MIGSDETLEPADVGLSRADTLPFEFRPGQRPSPLIVSFPHVGLDWPEQLGARPQVSFPRNADHAVDQLYLRAEALGAATVRARYSRLVIDLNRADDDVNPELVPDHPAPHPRPSSSTRRTIRNRGVIWANAVGNIPLLTTISHAALQQRLDRYYWPYYRAIERLLERRVHHYGYAILLDAHSMPGSVGGDLVLGTRSGQSCAPELITDAVEALSGLRGSIGQRLGSRWPLSVAIDDPYRGGQIVGAFGRPAANVHALQLEISRALYMDEYRLEPAPLPDASFLDGSGRSVWSTWSRPAQSQRDRRQLLALVGALDALVAELAREREELADRAAAE